MCIRDSLTGYQAEGSGGRKLLDDGRLPIWGNMTPIELDVEQFSLSNHAGHDELVEFARACSPRHLVIFHADEESAKALASELDGEMEIHIPENGTQITLE